LIILALDAALGRCSACVVSGGVILAERHQDGGRGQAALLAPMVADVLAQAGIAATALDAVAVTVGPGSFTGLRASIALAQGLAAGAGCRLIGVTVAEALIAALPANAASREVWVAIDSRRDRVFLLRGDDRAAFALDALPAATGRIAVAGDAAIAVACRLAARASGSIMLTDARLPATAMVAAVAARRLAGELPMLAVEPMYIDAPEAKLPAGGLRPAPS
jgi:tRNA threonylcarbamoyladenosine biosynthesis protein TsaB